MIVVVVEWGRVLAEATAAVICGVPCAAAAGCPATSVSETVVVVAEIRLE